MEATGRFLIRYKCRRENWVKAALKTLQYSWEETWIWTRSCVENNQVSGKVSWRTPVSKLRQERQKREEYNQWGYESLWESGEGSWLGISAWDVINLLFRLADKILWGKEGEMNIQNSFLEGEAEDWASLQPNCRPLQKDLKLSGWFFHISKRLYCTSWLIVKTCKGILWKVSSSGKHEGRCKVK